MLEETAKVEFFSPRDGKIEMPVIGDCHVKKILKALLVTFPISSNDLILS